MKPAQKIIDEMKSLYDEEQSFHLSKFFKTGKGEYGEGDKFLGIKVPQTRAVVKKYQKEVSLADISELLENEWHEIRLAGFLLLVGLYKRYIKENKPSEATNLVDFYLNHIEKGNNWDLVDLVAPYILGDWITRNPANENLLFELAEKDNKLWHKRVAIVATISLIKAHKFDITFQIAEKYLSNPHDLIHKATGWMLRETGKRGGKQELVSFLERNKWRMPRTMLRYAIEKFPENERKYFMARN